MKSYVLPRSEQLREERNHLLVGDLLELLQQADLTVYEELQNTNPAAKAEFLSKPHLIQPRFQYGELKYPVISRNLSIVENVRHGLEHSTLEKSSREYQLIQLLLDDRERKNRYLQSIIEYHNAMSPISKSSCCFAVCKANKALYGKPDRGVFLGLLEHRLAQIKRKLPQLYPKEQQVYYQLVERLPRTQLKKLGPATPVYRPSPALMAEFGHMIKLYLENFLRHVPSPPQTLSAAQAVTTLNKIIYREINSVSPTTLEPVKTPTSFRAILANERATASVDQIEKRLKIPGERPTGDWQNDEFCQTIIGHELGTHTMRTIVHEDELLNQYNQILPDCEEFDEGVAKCVEQALSGTYEQDDPGSHVKIRGIDHYINIGLADFCGLNFRRIFEICWRINYLRNTQPWKAADEKLRETCRKSAFTATTRCFRGTGDIVNSKDLCYYRGNVAVWQLIECYIDSPEYLMHLLFTSGKSNPLDPRQHYLIL